MSGAMVRKRVRRKGSAAPPSSSPAKRGLPSDDLSRCSGVPNDPELRCAGLAEAAGATAVGCAALCCCCSCGLLNLLFAVAVKLPAALLLRALTRRRRRKRRARGGAWKEKGGAFRDDDDEDLSRRDWGLSRQGTTWPAISQSRETAEMEKEMRGKFRSAGFWRSPSRSQRE